MFYDGDDREVEENDTMERKSIDFKIADFANCVTKRLPFRSAVLSSRHPNYQTGLFKRFEELEGYFLAIQQEIYNELEIAVIKLSNGTVIWHLMMETKMMAV